MKKQAVNGILLLDKPMGITSNAALQKVKKLFQAKKAGHTGSLDPLATGMLPICFGEATKLSQFLLNANKAYQVVAKLGIQTTTGDAEGEVVAEKPVEKISRGQLNKILAKFRGEISQIPSMYSALKHQGQPLYKLARQGITVDRPARQVTIHELEITDFEKDELSMTIRCSKGTYVRSLVEDIGHTLGCGAHVIALRRLATEPFNEQAMLTLENLQEAASNGNLLSHLQPIDSAVQQWPIVQLNEASVFYIRQGQAIQVPDLPDTTWVRLYQSGNRFIGVGEVLDDGRVAPRRLIKETDRVDHYSS